MKDKVIQINKIKIANNLPLAIIAGPCVIESRKHCLYLAAKLKDITSALDIPFIFKASYDKANRSSIDSFRGPGIKEGLDILAQIKKDLKIPVLTDVHTQEQAYQAAEIVDIIQIPAFLSRQTDLIKACSLTKIPVNVKKGQFLAPDDMINVIKKLEKFGNKDIMLTERGSTFGYHNLVVDFRGLEIMKQSAYPVIFDATHSVQLPGGAGNKSSGNREFVLPLSKAACAIGIAALFLEVHENPDKALSDSANSVNLKQFENILKITKKIDKAVKQ
ncbi:MAG: 3-deoxy-8-phosphooctulonate synthase [Elusimicrobiota bacterium]|jgi:2-dehydro-3-deoxyphosphooctonate aldolase (KDO 8-P synthase)|nr:3-deoxy-8-phosphooctulonate synthase [Elusimicrobiota bacterium]